MAYYRKIYPRFWKDERIVQLPFRLKTVALYLFTGQCNRVGIYFFSPALAVEDLSYTFDEHSGNVIETLKQDVREVVKTLNWHWDESARVIYIPSWWAYNPPENRNVLIGNLADAEELPKTELISLFYSNKTHLKESLHKDFDEYFFNVGGTLAECIGNQKQKQEQKQEQNLVIDEPPPIFENIENPDSIVCEIQSTAEPVKISESDLVWFQKSAPSLSLKFIRGEVLNLSEWSEKTKKWSPSKVHNKITKCLIDIVKQGNGYASRKEFVDEAKEIAKQQNKQDELTALYQHAAEKLKNIPADKIESALSSEVYELNDELNRLKSSITLAKIEIMKCWKKLNQEKS